LLLLLVVVVDVMVLVGRGCGEDAVDVGLRGNKCVNV
jgi:hypothetical protein